jgi:hypothetical protein
VPRERQPCTSIHWATRHSMRERESNGG